MDWALGFDFRFWTWFLDFGLELGFTSTLDLDTGPGLWTLESIYGMSWSFTSGDCNESISISYVKQSVK